MSVNYKVLQRFQAALKQQSGGLLGLADLFKSYDTDGKIFLDKNPYDEQTNIVEYV